MEGWTKQKAKERGLGQEGKAPTGKQGGWAREHRWLGGRGRGGGRFAKTQRSGRWRLWRQPKHHLNRRIKSVGGVQSACYKQGMNAASQAPSPMKPHLL